MNHVDRTSEPPNPIASCDLTDPAFSSGQANERSADSESAFTPPVRRTEQAVTAGTTVVRLAPRARPKSRPATQVPCGDDDDPGPAAA
jgi:hypothetical protein